jgi:uncharacterized protein YybS (DUF2232 family)
MTPPFSDSKRRSIAARRSSALALVETAFLASTGSLIWLIDYYFPLGPILRLFFSLPIALVYLRWNKREALMATAVSGLLLSVLMGPARSILFLMPYGLQGLVLGWLWTRRAKWWLSIAATTLLGTVGIFFKIWLLSVFLNQDLWVYFTSQVTELINWVLEKMGLFIQPSLELVQWSATAMIVVNNAVYVLVVHLVALLLFDRLGNPIPRPPQWIQVLLDVEYDEEPALGSATRSKTQGTTQSTTQGKTQSETPPKTTTIEDDASHDHDEFDF